MRGDLEFGRKDRGEGRGGWGLFLRVGAVVKGLWSLVADVESWQSVLGSLMASLSGIGSEVVDLSISPAESSYSKVAKGSLHFCGDFAA